MVKKILILSGLFLGLSSMAIYKATNGPANKNSEAKYAPIVVLELFTSQGCSSCPPADVILEEAKEKFPEEVFALSYHVDYWNYIGWEDPFSNPDFSKKQREYNIKFNYPSNYTPELVVNGKEHFVGSNSAKLNTKIKEYGVARTENAIKLIKLERKEMAIDFEYHVDGNTTGKLLRTVLVLDERMTSVKRGENRNRTLKNSNIVVQEKYIGLQSSKGKGQIKIPSWIGTNETLNLMLLVEKENLELTAATKTKI